MSGQTLPWRVSAAWQTCRTPSEWDPMLLGELADCQKHRAGDFGDAIAVLPSGGFRPILEALATFGTRGEPAEAAESPEAPPAYAPPPVGVLPRDLAAFVRSVSAAVNCDPAMVMLPALAVCAGAIGSTRGIAPKGGWAEPSVLWSVVISESGTRKSPAFDPPTAPLFDVLGERYDDHRRRLAVWEAEGKAASPRPVLAQPVTSDATIEALAEVLRDNPHGCAIVDDELTSWFESLRGTKDRSGQSGKWLKLYDAKRITNNRKTGDTKFLYVPRATVSVCGGIQPGIFAEAMGSKERSSGLMARLLLAWPPRRPNYWSDAEPDPDAVGRYGRLVRRLLCLRPESTPDGERAFYYHFDPAARKFFVDWTNRLAERQFHLTGGLAAHVAKLGGTCARFALVFHCCDYTGVESDDRRDVSLQTTERAAALADWAIDETERVYLVLDADPLMQGRSDVYQYLADRGGVITPKAMRDNNKSRWRTASAASAELDELVRAGLASWRDRPAGERGGRPTRECVLHPTLPRNLETSKPHDDAEVMSGEQVADDEGVSRFRGFEASQPEETAPDIWPA